MVGSILPDQLSCLAAQWQNSSRSAEYYGWEGFDLLNCAPCLSQRALSWPWATSDSLGEEFKGDYYPLSHGVPILKNVAPILILLLIISLVPNLD